jgi:hypothetical protein
MNVFISYGFKDYDAVKRMKESLSGRFDVFCFEQQNDIGKPLWDTIVKRIDWADVFIVYITPATLDRAMSVGQESGHAKKAGKFIIPLKDKGVSAQDLGMLADLKWIEIDQENPGTAYQTLADTIWDYALTQEKQKAKKTNNLLWVLGGLLFLSLFGGGDYEDDY